MLNAMFPGNGDLANISLQGEDGLYWVYHEPGFIYTGAELADWEALEY
jgi:proline utilization trans-activator